MSFLLQAYPPLQSKCPIIDNISLSYYNLEQMLYLPIFFAKISNYKLLQKVSLKFRVLKKLVKEAHNIYCQNFTDFFFCSVEVDFDK